MAVDEWRIDEALVLCRDNVSVDGDVVYLPWYALAFLEQEALPATFIVDP